MAVKNPSPPINAATIKGIKLECISWELDIDVTLIAIPMPKLNIQTAAPIIAITKALFVPFLKLLHL
jgi:hypothetical protein